MTGEADAGLLMRYTFAAGDYYKAMGIDVLDGQARVERRSAGVAARRLNPYPASRIFLLTARRLYITIWLLNR
jgi:hypothetical protein